MNIKKSVIGFAATFAVTLVVCAVVTYLWNLIVHGQGAFNWGLSVTLAVIVGIILPVTRAMMSRKE